MLDETAPLTDELVPLILPVLLLRVLGVSLRTCLVALSQHFVAPEGALGDVVVVEVWAIAIPMLPATIAVAISPIFIIRILRIPAGCKCAMASLARTYGNRRCRGRVPGVLVTKRAPAAAGSAKAQGRPRRRHSSERH